jgi:hypothetical protein
VRPADRGDAAGRDADPGGAPADGRASAARSLDSLAGVLRRGAVDAGTARTVAGAIRALGPRLAAGDRTRADLSLIDASVLSGDLASACAAVRRAARSAGSAAQRAAVRRYDEQLGCGL